MPTRTASTRIVGSDTTFIHNGCRVIIDVPSQAAGGAGQAAEGPQGAAAAARTYGTVVTLVGAGTDTQGAVHCHQLKSLDWRARNVSLQETVPHYIVDEALARIEAILFE